MIHVRNLCNQWVHSFFNLCVTSCHEISCMEYLSWSHSRLNTVLESERPLNDIDYHNWTLKKLYSIQLQYTYMDMWAQIGFLFELCSFDQRWSVFHSCQLSLCMYVCILFHFSYTYCFLYTQPCEYIAQKGSLYLYTLKSSKYTLLINMPCIHM